MKKSSEFINVFLLAVLILLQIGCGKKDEDAGSQAEGSRTSEGIRGSDETEGSQTPTDIAGTRATESSISQSNKEAASLVRVLALWDRGNKDAATEEFLSVRWNDPTALANVPVMNLSEEQFGSLSKEERDRTMKEYKNLRTKLLIGVVRHVRSVGDSALAKGDKQKAEECYDGILRCGQALSSPNRLALMKLDGEAAVRMGQKGLSSLDD